VDAGAVPALDGLAAVLLVAAVWAPAYDVVEPGWIGVASAGLAAVLLLGARWLPADRRTAPAVIVLLAGLLPTLAALEPLGRALQGLLRPLEQPWSWTPASVPLVVDRPAAVLLVEAAALLVIGSLALRRRELVAAAIPVLGAAGLLAAPALRASYRWLWPRWSASRHCCWSAVACSTPADGSSRAGAALGTGAVLLALASSWAPRRRRHHDPHAPGRRCDAAGGGDRGPRPAGDAALAGGPGRDVRCWWSWPRLPPWPGTTVPAGLLSGRWRWACWWRLPPPRRLRCRCGQPPGDVFWAPLHTAVVCVGAAAMVADAAAAGPMGRQHARWLRPRGRRHRGGPDGADGGAAARPAGRCAARCRSWPGSPPARRSRSRPSTVTGSGWRC
jgi:hypothetical protein